MKPNTLKVFRIAVGWAAGVLSAAALHAQSSLIVLPTTYVLPASAGDAAQPGFTWNISEVLPSEPNQLAWAEGQLLGLEGVNYADPTAQGVALAPAQPADPPTAPVSFVIPGVLNVSKTAGTSKGNFTPDDQMPGIPGTGGNNGTDNIAAEVLTYLLLPAGTNTMAVNSDDGFRLTLAGGNPADKFAVNVGQYDGGRGAADTIFQFVVAQPGLYAARVLYENGGGDANIEWFTILDGPGGTNRVLVNDVANGGIAAYRAVTQSKAYTAAVDPGIGATGVVPNEGVHVKLVDGSTPVAASSIGLAIDGVVVTPSFSKNGKTTSVDYTLPTPWPPGSMHLATFTYTDGSLKVTNSWNFSVQTYTTLDPSWVVANADTSKPGFTWNIFANPDGNNKANNNERAELDLSAQAADATGTLLINLADPAAIGSAVGPGTPSASPNGPVHFEIAGVLNVDSATNSMPGSPSTDASTDGQAAEVVTYVSLPAGIIHMQIAGSHGWRLYSGANPGDLFGRKIVAELNDGTGPTDFSVNVPQAGVYPFRLIWQNGGGTGSLVWNVFPTPGNKVALNDVANGGFAAYRALTTGPAVSPTIAAVTPVPAIHQFETPNTSVTVVLKDGARAVTDSSVSLTVDGKTVTPVKTRSGPYLTITDNGASFTGLQLPSDVHSATLTFKDATGATRTQSWNFNNIQILVLPANPVLSENFDSYPEATSVANTVPPGWTAWNYTAENTPGWDLTMKDSDSYKNWIIISTDTMNSIEGGTATYNAAQLVNGQPVASFFSGNVLWATSDGRSGTQAQFCTSAPFNLSSVNNPVMTYSSIIRTSNGGNAQGDGIEYSVDGGKTWLPAVIYVTIAYGTEGNIKLTPDGGVDAVATLTAPGSIVAYWTDPVSGKTVGGNTASGLAEPATPDLARYIAPRSNNQSVAAKVDGVRLPLAANQKDVRLRFFQLGNCSWWWGVDNLAFYDIAPPVTPPVNPTVSISLDGSGKVTLTFTGTLQSGASPSGPFTPVAGAVSPFKAASTGGQTFYRAVTP